MRNRRHAALMLAFVTGCSTHPIADTCDFFKPGHLYPDKVTPYGGVCIRQGPGPTATSPLMTSTPVIPPAVPIPPSSGAISVPTIPSGPGGGPVPIPNTTPPPFPTAPSGPQPPPPNFPM